MTGSEATGRAHPFLADTRWPAEDGGPRRRQRPSDGTGPQAGSGRLAATRFAPLSVMALHGRGGRLFVLRNTPGPDGVSWVEEVDPESLDEIRRSPDLALGPYWPGGMVVLDDDHLVVVQGRHAHRLDPDLSPVATRVFDVEAPHNSGVVLADGSIAVKDLQFPGVSPSTLSVLDPVTLADRCAPLELAEPVVARLSADGNDVVVVGVDHLWRVRFDPEAGTLTTVDEPLRYRTEPTQSYGWDPVCDDGAVWWLDNGDHTFTNGLTMLGNGVSDGPVRLWRERNGELASVEVCGLPRGAVTNPPVVDSTRGLVVGYDSANGVMAAFRTDDLASVWQVPLRTSTHLVLHVDSGELVANDHAPDSGDAVVVVDVATGAVRCRVPVESPAQSVVFGCPGFGRDHVYVSLSTIARVEFAD